MMDGINEYMKDLANSKSSTEIQELQRKNEDLAAVVHAMWMMLRDHGATDNDFNAALAEVIELRKTTQFGIDYKCPQCGNNLQNLGSFKIKCLYCGNEFVTHPFAKYDFKAEPAPEQPVSAEPSYSGSYDVAQDLTFDDIG